jgi:voltage-gated potassium channel
MGGNAFVRLANSPRMLVLAAVAILGSSTVAFELVEHRGFAESLWFAIVTATTVGYGDTYPATNAGRVVASLLVVSMVLFFIPLVTASFASKLIVDRNAFTHEEQEEIKDGIARVLRRLGDEEWEPKAHPTGGPAT